MCLGMYVVGKVVRHQLEARKVYLSGVWLHPCPMRWLADMRIWTAPGFPYSKRLGPNCKPQRKLPQIVSLLSITNVQTFEYARKKSTIEHERPGQRVLGVCRVFDIEKPI